MSSKQAKRRNSGSSLEAESKPSKRAKKQNDAKDDPPLEFTWEDKGTILPDGSVEHNRLEVTQGDDSMIIMVGDSILLSRQGTVRTAESDDFVARVEKMWQGLPKKRGVPAKMMVQCRWYYKKQDIEAIKGSFTGTLSRDELLSKMDSHDLVLSNQCDENDVESIVSRCFVVQRKPSTEKPPEAPEEIFVSSYRINFDKGSSGSPIELTVYDGPDEPWPVFEPEDFEEEAEEEEVSEDKMSVDESAPSKPPAQEPKKVMRSPSISEGSKALRNKRSSMSMTDDASSASSTSPSPTSGDEASLDFSQEEDLGPDTEGSTTKGSIFVGPEHQVDVPPFTPGQTVASRNPIQVWSPGAVSDDVVDGYLKEASKILNAYMKEHDLVIDDPYAPLPSARIEAMLQAENNGKPLTLSRFCTASSLSKDRNELTRECKLDELLSTLQSHEYNPEKALAYVAGHPSEFLTIWTEKERESFDNVFRRHSGSLRMITKALAGQKTFKDVVDYHYRFKIPDQFRRYQEKKREQALRMMECVESRRSLEAPIYQRQEAEELRKRAAAKKNGQWNKTSVADVTGAVDDRRIAAKELFLKVQNELGADAMYDLALAVKSLAKDGEIEDVRDMFVEVLRDHPDLLDSFLEFLPKRYRGSTPRTSDMHVF